jgi:acetylglutamate kinase
MASDHSPTLAIAALRRAIPYLRLYQGKTFVVKASGEVFTSPASTRALVEQLGILHQLGIHIVLVHGGGAQATDLAAKLGVESHFVQGRRVTSPAMLELMAMTLSGSVNTAVLAAARALKVPAIGISGVDCGLVRARKRPPKREADGSTTDWGMVGDIVSINAAFIQKLLSDDMLPVVSPISADDDGQLLNLNADVIAARLAVELHAEKLLLVTGVPGILRNAADSASLISYTDIKGLNALHEQGALSGGMLPKTAAIKDALYGGVPRVHVVSFRIEDGLLTEVFTNEGCGTLVVLDTSALLPEEMQPPSRIQSLLASAEPAS